MGGRYFITGTQLGMFKALIKNKDIQRILKQVEEKQFIGNSKFLNRLMREDTRQKWREHEGKS